MTRRTFTPSFDQIYPFLRQIVSQMAGHCGVPGLMIPIMRLNKDTVTVGGPDQSPLN